MASEILLKQARFDGFNTFQRMAIMVGMSEEERLELTRAILNMLDDWEIEAKDQLVLLGLSGVRVERSSVCAIAGPCLMNRRSCSVLST